MSVNIEILDILANTSCSPSVFRNFVGITKDSLRRLPLTELEHKLQSLLPSEPNRDSVIKSIINQLLLPPTAPTQPSTTESDQTPLQQQPGSSNSSKVQGVGGKKLPGFPGAKENPFKRKLNPVSENTKAFLPQDWKTVIWEKDTHKLGRTPPSPSEFPKGNEEWTWSEWDNICSSYLSSRIVRLAIVSNCIRPSTQSHQLVLSNLQILRIISRYASDINYSTQLMDIVKGVARGKKSSKTDHEIGLKIELLYNHERSLIRFLHALSSIEPNELNNLESLWIHRGELGFIVHLPSEIRILSRIQANNLAELCLGMHLCDDVKEEFEGMLKQFSKLRKLQVYGSFVTFSNPTLKVVINFPKMINLETLDMGGSCSGFGPYFETVTEIPIQKKWKVDYVRKSFSPFTKSGSSSIPRRPGINFNQNAEDDRNGVGEGCKVYLNFLGMMPSLKFVILGRLFEINDLHFTDMPNLQVFRVSSPWHDAFPRCFERRSDNKDEATFWFRVLQFPDLFQDCNLLPKILAHFPYLWKCHLNLPTVKLLRAFASIISGNPVLRHHLKHLDIRTQFDFPSSLNDCIFDDINQAPHPSTWEMEQVRILKQYKYWKEYVQENQIELPCFLEGMPSEDNAKFCGLQKLIPILQTLTVSHTPRTLRLPMGEKHWIDDDNCEFSSTLIGLKQFPFSNLESLNLKPKLDFGFNFVRFYE